jgi:hypothetical protein
MEQKGIAQINGNGKVICGTQLSAQPATYMTKGHGTDRRRLGENLLRDLSAAEWCKPSQDRHRELVTSEY